MLVAHHVLAVGVLAVTVVSAAWAGFVYVRHRPASLVSSKSGAGWPSATLTARS